MASQALTFQQLAACLVHAVKELTIYVKGDGPQLTDKDIEEKVQVIHNIVSLGFSIPQTMALAILHVLVELVTDKLPLEKDFVIAKALRLIRDVYSAVGRDPKVQPEELFSHPSFQESLLNQIKWTLFLVKEAPAVSPNFVLEAIKGLNEQLGALKFEALQASMFVESCFPGLSSIATKAITDDYKCSLKVKLAMLTLWSKAVRLNQPTLKQTLAGFADRQKSVKAVHKALMVRSLLLKVSNKEEAEEADVAKAEPDELLERLS